MGHNGTAEGAQQDGEDGSLKAPFTGPPKGFKCILPLPVYGTMKPEEIAEKLTRVQIYSLLLARAGGGNPIRGKLWLQKEMFLLSRAIPELGSELGYEPSLKGPMSEALEWDVDQLVSVDLLHHEGSSYVITESGDVCAKVASREVQPSDLRAIVEVKELLNELSKDELLAFIYFLYPDMITESEELEDLLPKREELAVRLFEKGKVGLEKGAQIAGVDVPKFTSMVGRQGIARYAD